MLGWSPCDAPMVSVPEHWPPSTQPVGSVTLSSIARLTVGSTGTRIVSLPFSDHCDCLVDDAETLSHLLARLNELAQERNCRFVELRPAATPVEARDRFTNIRTFYRHQLDLRPGLQEVFSHFHKDCIQRKIRRAEREHIAVETGNTPYHVGQFYELVIRTRKRQGLPPQPMAWYRNLIECLKSAAMIHLARQDDRVIAGILMLQHKKCLVYKYGASDERFHSSGCVPLLHRHAIEDAIASGLEELDMGRSDINNPGLIAFKEHLGARRSLLRYWRSPAIPAEQEALPQSLVGAVCRHLPPPCLSVLGKLLYRHVA